MKTRMVIGIDLGGTNIKGGLLDGEGRIITRQEVATLANAGPRSVAARIAGMIVGFEAWAETAGGDLAGVGIGVPGQPDQAAGTVVWAPNLRWQNVPLAAYLGEMTRLPVLLENDANVAALGEQWTGAGRGSVNMVMVTIGTGIGGGIIINGSLYTGANGSAGEIGHTVIDPEGPRCGCGRNGCLETLTSATAMVRMAKEAIEQGSDSCLARVENLEARDIFMAAGAGDTEAVRIINTAAGYLGMGLGNIINVLNPDTIVVGGGVSKAGDILFRPLRQSAMKWSLEAAGGVVSIVPAELGNDAGIIGAGRLVLKKHAN